MDEFLTGLIPKIEKATDSESLLILLESINELELMEQPKDEGTGDYHDIDLKIRCFNLLAEAYDNAGKKINSDKNKFRALSNFSKVYLDTSKFWQKQAIEVQEVAARNLMQHGIQLQVEKKHQEAIRVLQDAITLQPSTTEKSAILVSLGKSYNYLNRLEDASKSFKEALEEDPNNPLALYGIGMLHSRLKNYPDAIKSFDRAIKISPHEVNFHIELGLIYYAIKEYAEAKKCFAKATEIDPESYLAWNALGGVYNDGFSNDKEAERCFRKALDRNPDSLTVRTNLAEVLLTQARYDECEEFLKQVIKVTDSHRHGLVSRLLLVCSYFLHDKADKDINNALTDLINYYESLPMNYNFEWYFDALKRTIEKSSKLSEEHKQNLVRLLTTMEGGKNDEAFRVVNGLVKTSFGLSDAKTFVLNQITRKTSQKLTAANIMVYNTSEPDNDREGWYVFEVFIGPDTILGLIDSVKYILHPTFQTNEVSIKTREDGFRLRAAGWGEFRIKLEILLTNTQRITKYYWLKLSGPTPLDTIYTQDE